MKSIFPRTQSFIDSRPKFRLNRPGRPSKLPSGQRTIVFECLEAAQQKCLTLDSMVEDCLKRGYRERLKTETNVHRSILYHLNRIDAVERCSD